MRQHMWGAICLSVLLPVAACDMVTSPGEDDAASDDATETGTEPVLVRRQMVVPIVATARTDTIEGGALSEEGDFDDPDRCLPP